MKYEIRKRDIDIYFVVPFGSILNTHQRRGIQQLVAKMDMLNLQYLILKQMVNSQATLLKLLTLLMININECYFTYLYKLVTEKINSWTTQHQGAISSVRLFTFKSDASYHSETKGNCLVL